MASLRTPCISPHSEPSHSQLVLICISGRSFFLAAYMQKTYDVEEKAILAKKKIAEKLRKSRQNVNRDKSA